MSGIRPIAELPFCRPCPTASNSIELVAAMLRRRRLPTALVEPTFDNLALLLHRREVSLHAIDERLIFDDTAIDALEQQLVTSGVGALFIVSPSNPTGRCLTSGHFSEIAELCMRCGVMLVIDSSFRMYNRDLFDDVALLLRSGVSFIAFEDTGKSFPTLDTKASLIYASPDLASELETLYNEVYLCASGISLLLLSRAFERTHEAGIDNVLWSLVDQRRMQLSVSSLPTGARQCRQEQTLDRCRAHERPSLAAGADLFRQHDGAVRFRFLAPDDHSTNRCCVAGSDQPAVDHSLCLRHRSDVMGRAERR